MKRIAGAKVVYKMYNLYDAYKKRYLEKIAAKLEF